MKRANFPSRPVSRAFQVVVWAAALTVVACDNSTTFSPAESHWPVGPTRLSMISGNDQTGIVGQALDAPFVVQVVDRDGGPVSGVVVLWDIVQGGGDLPGVPKGLEEFSYETRTDDRGYVSVVLTLGPRPGPNVVESKLLFDADSLTWVATGQAGGW